jgi:flagellar biogenesis protein FliO
MRHDSSTPPTRRGITVLGLLLLIIALVVAAVFLIRYLRTSASAA